MTDPKSWTADEAADADSVPSGTLEAVSDSPAIETTGAVLAVSGALSDTDVSAFAVTAGGADAGSDCAAHTGIPGFISRTKLRKRLVNCFFFLFSMFCSPLLKPVIFPSIDAGKSLHLVICRK